MARRTWWKVGALLAAMMVFLTMLPATALAAAPEDQVIYVGGEEVTSSGYWTTDSEGKVTSAGATQPSNNYIHYDAGKNTLTLHNATIKNELGFSDSIEGGTYINGSAIGVFNQNGNAELTIQLQGQENTLSETSTGIHVYSHSGTASLTITGSGSLNASGFANPGISVQSNNGDATLTIQNAEVTATSTHSDGVRVLTAADKSASLTVDGGSLTATGKNENGAGIRYTFGGSSSGSGKPSLTVSGNAIVRANGGIANNSSSPIQYETGSDSTGGIVFDGNEGTVYGKVTLQGNLEISEGESLTIPDGANLNTDGKLTVDGGTLTQNGTVTGDIIYKVTGVSLSTDSLTLEEGGTANLTATITPANATNQNVTWSSNAPSVATVSSSGNVTAVAPGTATITVTTEDGNKTATCAVTVAAATVSVTGVTLNKTSLSLTVGGTVILNATITPSEATNKNVTWSSDNEEVATVDENGLVTAVGVGTATITATVNDGSGLSASCVVQVLSAVGIEQVTENDIKVDASDSKIIVSGMLPGDMVTVCDMEGRLVYKGEEPMVGVCRQRLYLVTVRGKTCKIFVR